jgi:hypothetical protein
MRRQFCEPAVGFFPAGGSWLRDTRKIFPRTSCFCLISTNNATSDSPFVPVRFINSGKKPSRILLSLLIKNGDCSVSGLIIKQWEISWKIVGGLAEFLIG